MQNVVFLLFCFFKKRIALLFLYFCQPLHSHTQFLKDQRSMRIFYWAAGFGCEIKCALCFCNWICSALRKKWREHLERVKKHSIEKLLRTPKANTEFGQEKGTQRCSRTNEEPFEDWIGFMFWSRMIKCQAFHTGDLFLNMDVWHGELQELYALASVSGNNRWWFSVSNVSLDLGEGDIWILIKSNDGDHSLFLSSLWISEKSIRNHLK